MLKRQPNIWISIIFVTLSIFNLFLLFKEGIPSQVDFELIASIIGIFIFMLIGVFDIDYEVGVRSRNVKATPVDKIQKIFERNKIPLEFQKKLFHRGGTQISQIKDAHKKVIEGAIKYDPRANVDQLELIEQLRRDWSDYKIKFYLTEPGTYYFNHFGVLLINTEIIKKESDILEILIINVDEKRKLFKFFEKWLKKDVVRLIRIGKKFVQFEVDYDFVRKPNEMNELINDIVEFDLYFDEPGFETEELREQILKRKILVMEWK